MIEENPSFTTRQIAEEFECDETTVVCQLKRLGYTLKLRVWVRHELTDTMKQNRCARPLRRHEIATFLDRIVAGDEKWILNSNVTKTKSWSPKRAAP